MSAEPLVLAIESATGSVGCAVGGSGGVLAAASSGRTRRHAESLAPQIAFVMQQAGVTLQDLDAVAVDIGPGLYTGLRVGITTGIALARTLGVGVVALGSLDVLAHGVRHHDAPIHAVIDARRGEVFHAAFAPGPGRLSRVAEPRVAEPGELAASLSSSGPVVLAGDGVAAHPQAFAGIEGVVIDVAPRAEDVLAMAVPEVIAGRVSTAAEIRPAYLREPDAVAKWGAA